MEDRMAHESTLDRIDARIEAGTADVVDIRCLAKAVRADAQRIAELERQLKINAGYEETALADIRHLKAECERMQPVVDAAMAMYRGGAYTPFDRVVHVYLKGKG